MTTEQPGADLVASSTDSSPFLRRNVTRRSVLAGMLGIGIGAALDFSPLRAYATQPKKTRPRKVGDGSVPAQPGPYAITATSELADDVFATDEVRIGDGDQLLPFYNPASKAVEALVFSNGTLSHLHRDPTQATGWHYASFDLQQTLTSVTSVAVAADDKRVYALLWGDPDMTNNLEGSPYWLTWLDDATNWNAGYLAVTGDDNAYPPAPGAIKGGISRQGVPYFYTTAVAGSTTSLVGWVTTGDPNNALSPIDLIGLDPASGPVKDYLVLYDTGAGDTVGYALVLYTSSNLSVYPQQGQTFSQAPMDDAGADGATELMWAWASPTSTTGLPGYAIQGIIGNVEGAYFCDEAGNFTRVADSPEKGDNSVAVWLQNDQYTVNLLDTDATLQTIQQTAPGTFATAVPIANGIPGSANPGLAAVYGVPTDPTQATLFAVGYDEMLSILSLDSGSWTQTQVRQDYTVATSITSYQVSVQISDVNGTAVRYGQAQLTTDRPVGLWQDIGSTALIPALPITMTADILGQITFSVPAEEMDTAVITVQALDADGNATGQPLDVVGDYDVRNFLGGAAALNSLGTISASALTGVLPNIDSGTANSLITGLKGAITAGNGGTPTSGAVHAYKLERHGKTLKATTSHDPKAFGTAKVGDSASNLFHAIGHALRHALDKIHQAVISFDTLAKQWVVQLETDLIQLTTFYINDMRDAFHVIGGWFSTLGADIVKGLNWLKREILGFLSGVGKNATTIGGMLSAAPDQLIGIVGGIEKKVDGWFASQEATVSGWINDLAEAVEDATFGDHQPLQPSSSSDTGGSTAMNNLGKDVRWITKVVNDTPGMWLYHKIMQHLPQTPGPDLSGVFDQVLQDLADAWTDSTELGADIVRTFFDSVKDVTSHGALTATKVSAWFNDLNGVVQSILQLCDKIADTVLDFVIAALNALDKYLSYQWQLVSIPPCMKILLDELGWGSDLSISLNRLVSMVVSFPLTLIRTLMGRNPVFTTGASVADGSDTIDSFCYTIAAIAQFIWTGADLIGDLEQTTEEGAPSRPQQPGIIDYFDIICPLLQTIVLLPGRGDNLIWSGLPSNTKMQGLLAPSIIASVITPVMKIAGTESPAPPTTNPNVIVYYKDAPAEGTSLDQYFGPIVSMLAAAANAIMGGWYGYANAGSGGADAEAIIGVVLGNASNLASPFTTWWLNDSTEFTPLLAKLVLDGVAGVGAGVLYATEAALA